jgi:hypothetical protein
MWLMATGQGRSAHREGDRSPRPISHRRNVSAFQVFDLYQAMRILALDEPRGLHREVPAVAVSARRAVLFEFRTERPSLRLILCRGRQRTFVNLSTRRKPGTDEMPQHPPLPGSRRAPRQRFRQVAVALKQGRFCDVSHPHICTARSAAIVPNHGKPSALHCQFMPTMRTLMGQVHIHQPDI